MIQPHIAPAWEPWYDGSGSDNRMIFPPFPHPTGEDPFEDPLRPRRWNDHPIGPWGWPPQPPTPPWGPPYPHRSRWIFNAAVRR